jgi:hypothetical protein
MPPKRISSSDRTKPRSSKTPSGETERRAPKSWLPGDRFTPKQLGLIVLGIALTLAVCFDLFNHYTADPAARLQVMLNSLVTVGDALPRDSQPCTSVEELDLIGSAAQAAADELEDLDADAQPKVVQEAAIVTRDVALAVAPMALTATDSNALEASIRTSIRAADIALHAQVDEPHLALVLIAAVASHRWANLAAQERGETALVDKDTVSGQLMLRRAALLEQAVAILPTQPDLRLMYCSALIELQRYADARQQLEHLLRKHPKYKHRRTVEWLDALAVQHGALGEYDAAEALRGFSKETPVVVVPHVNLFEGRLRFPTIDAKVVELMTPP